MRRLVLACAVFATTMLGASGTARAGCVLYWPDECCKSTGSGWCVNGGNYCTCQQVMGPNYRFCYQDNQGCVIAI